MDEFRESERAVEENKVANYASFNVIECDVDE